MRRIESLSVFVAAVEEKKCALGITAETIAAIRNDGERRTPEKRATLARLLARARRAGQEPYPAKF